MITLWFLPLMSCGEEQAALVGGITIVKTTSPVYSEVGQIFVDKTRVFATFNLCLQGNFNVVIQDVFNPLIASSNNIIPKQTDTIFLPWIFETNSKKDSDTGYSHQEELSITHANIA